MYCFSWDPSVIPWGDVSGWLQAIFSVVAIVAAIWLSRQDKKHADLRNRDARVEEMFRIKLLVDSCSEHIATALEQYQNPGLAKHSESELISRLSTLLRMTKEVSLYQLPAGKVDEFLDLIDAIGTTLRYLEGEPSINGAEAPERILKAIADLRYQEARAKVFSKSIEAVILKRLGQP